MISKILEKAKGKYSKAGDTNSDDNGGISPAPPAPQTQPPPDDMSAEQHFYGRTLPPTPRHSSEKRDGSQHHQEQPHRDNGPSQPRTIQQEPSNDSLKPGDNRMEFQPLVPDVIPSPPRSPQNASVEQQQQQQQDLGTTPPEHDEMLEDASTHAPVLSSDAEPRRATPQPRRRSTAQQFRLQDFRLLRTLGTGSFGRVHLTQSRHNNRFYAMKVLKKSQVVRLKQINHTKNERDVLIRISHPFIVNLWGTFQDDANLYMIMDFVAGGELFSLLRKSKRFSNEMARFYAAEVLMAIVYLHNQDILYRDLKPENILLDATGHVRLTDFGFAKRVPDVTWTLCGTPDYLAPEVIQSKGYGKAVDYWSLGILIYEMLAGYPPFFDDSQFRLYEKILTSEPRYPPHFDPQARDLLTHLLTTDLTSRYGNLKRGYHDITEHPWFADIDFEQLLQRKVQPPYVPQLSSEGDTSNFEKYQEENMPYGVAQADPYHRYFQEF
jgi:serine/threonine protein kinase